MARHDHLRQLRAFADIREAQKRAADARLSDAQRGLARQQDRLASEQDEQVIRGEAWAANVAGGRLDLQLAWARALHDGEDAVARAARAVQRAVGRCDDARAESRAAEARRKATETVMTQAVRRARRRADEAAIAESEDRFAGRRAP